MIKWIAFVVIDKVMNISIIMIIEESIVQNFIKNDFISSLLVLVLELEVLEVIIEFLWIIWKINFRNKYVHTAFIHIYLSHNLLKLSELCIIESN